MISSLPDKKYNIVLADPPWNIKWQASKSIGKKPLEYRTMTMMELAKFPVIDIVDDSSKLFLWSTNQFLPEALGLLGFWGFQYNKLWTWCKKTGAGGHPRNATEHIIESTRGEIKSIGRHEKAINNWFIAKSGRHSEKPDIVYDIIEYCYPDTEKIELFARKRRDGWDAWGNEILEVSREAENSNQLSKIFKMKC